MNPPTEKQKYAARIISGKLGIKLPSECSRGAYWKFISENMEKSKRVSARSYRAGGYSQYRDAYRHSQHESDWEAVNLNSDTWAQRIMDGKTMPPSWCNETLQQTQRRLHALGYRSSLERENAALREQLSGWYGLEGSAELWD